jgi:hypothetical protein
MNRSPGHQHALLTRRDFSVAGDGSCEAGNAVELEFGDEGDAAITDLIEYGDSIYEATLAAQAYALQLIASSPAPSASPASTASAG